jgi:hypothetical protein
MGEEFSSRTIRQMARDFSRGCTIYNLLFRYPVIATAFLYMAEKGQAHANFRMQEVPSRRELT